MGSVQPPRGRGAGALPGVAGGISRLEETEASRVNCRDAVLDLVSVTTGTATQAALAAP